MISYYKMYTYIKSKSIWSHNIKNILNTEGLDTEPQLVLKPKEIRRFNALDVATYATHKAMHAKLSTFEWYEWYTDNLELIKNRYESLLNKYQTYDLKLYWKDEDGDSIEISDEIDLMHVFRYYDHLAIHEDKDKTLKIYVYLENVTMKR